MTDKSMCAEIVLLNVETIKRGDQIRADTWTCWFEYESALLVDRKGNILHPQDPFTIDPYDLENDDSKTVATHDMCVVWVDGPLERWNGLDTLLGEELVNVGWRAFVSGHENDVIKLASHLLLDYDSIRIPVVMQFSVVDRSGRDWEGIYECDIELTFKGIYELPMQILLDASTFQEAQS